MTYRPSDQALQPAIDKTIEGFQELLEAIRNRINAPTEWQEEHLIELAGIHNDILSMQIRLQNIRMETW